MRHVTIQLSDAQEALLSERLAHGEYASLDELVAALLAFELGTDAQDRLEALLIEGLDSEELDCSLDELFDGIRREVGLAR